MRTRLALVRTEFDYLKHFARVVHLHQAWQVLPDGPSLERLLDAIDARNAFIETLYAKGHQREWNHVLFPFPGHDANHLRLAYDGYQEPYANTCFNWDTKSMRGATPPPKRLTVARTGATLTLDSPEWRNVAAQELTLVPPLHTLPRTTTIRLLQRWQGPPSPRRSAAREETTFEAYQRDRLLSNQEAIDVYLAPNPSQPLYYRFLQGANAATKYDALNGRITDVMDPRHGRDDPTWNGEWTGETRVDAANRRWIAHLVFPFTTLGVEPPAKRHRLAGEFRAEPPASAGDDRPRDLVVVADEHEPRRRRGDGRTGLRVIFMKPLPFSSPFSSPSRPSANSRKRSAS